jgi:hypothetical protein
MNASMARRIRNAEAILISAIDRHKAASTPGVNRKRFHHSSKKPVFSGPIPTRTG